MARLVCLLLCACTHRVPVPDPARCRVIQALPGPEDLVFDGVHNRWLGSWVERRGGSPGPSGIFALEGERFRALPMRGKETLFPVSPHGMDWLEPGGHLFLVDHVSSRRHRILRLVSEEDHLRVETEFTSPLLSSANDVVAVAPDEFYVSVDLGSTTPMKRFWEALTARRWGGVLHYRRGEWRWAVRGIAFANGIELSADDRYLFVSAYQQGEILRYPRDPQTGVLGPGMVYAQIPGHPDNLTWSRVDGALIVASHDSLWDLFWHLQDEEHHASGAVYRLQSPGGVERLFWDDGRRIDAPSVAWEAPGYLLMGQVFDDELLRCAQPRVD